MTEQQRLAQLIRDGYKLHGFEFGQKYFYDITNHSACPAFAAWSTKFPIKPSEQEFEDLAEETVDIHETIAKDLGFPKNLICAVSDRHALQLNKQNSLESTLELLENNQLGF